MFKVIKNDGGGMHIRIERREAFTNVKKTLFKEAPVIVRLFGIKKKKGDVKEVVKKNDNTLKHVCEICNREFDKEVGLRIHTIKKHK